MDHLSEDEESVEEYLLRLITRARKMSKQRVVIEKTKHQIVITRDIRKEIASINQKAEEWDRRQAEVAEELLPQRKEKHDEVTAANVAVRAAVGGNDLASRWQLMYKEAQQKREGLGKDSMSQAVMALRSAMVKGELNSLRTEVAIILGRNARVHQMNAALLCLHCFLKNRAVDVSAAPRNRCSSVIKSLKAYASL
uniref:Uncharacterized protein n=1 Tax=Ananas comosus var. bracteatus TaxID=296719 RepID=A0A6V7Q4B8_ANACO|nr:unnamed protein product [Ananas comosus var. bracteatus]